MMNWLRNSVVASALLTIVRIYVGWKFLDAGWGKVTGDKAFDSSGFLKGAIAKSTGDKPSVQEWYGNFLDGFALPNVDLFNFLVQWGELLVGIGLILGTLTTFAAIMGLLMNFNYVLAGTVSINANLIFLGFFIVAAGFNAGRFGGDYFVIPFLRSKLLKSSNKQNSPGVGLQG
ncbi:DoxX family membrane protein [Tumebacillus permanentifrigoris]|uniref:Thiosulfate dehydrogenase [quinone] large subunit n=1 Tax=Tumebacillus permanentifrigoris TaxID=378543 RepID=A0A316DXJ9_9BACL|nr:DoxX family protein [Tumebacillus permanentifrigoris]PWK14841.1 thiosulfate dehydrogenase [quinone] large subunit [Tumebacillus permanentifrigoris]